MLIILKVVE
ncbi:hypothetical protein ACS0PU_008765 [Formica fusca]